MNPDGNKTGKAVYIVTLKRILAKLLFPPEAPLASVSCPIRILDVLKFVSDTPNSLTRSGKSMVTDLKNDHQPLPAPYQPAYHCSVWQTPSCAIWPSSSLSVKHKGAHSLCRWDVAAPALEALCTCSTISKTAYSPACLISPSMETNSRNFSKDGLC